jgi:DNA-binding transcriptional LysR family regulator
MKLNWDDLKIFLAVARVGTLAAAARQLGQSQPTIGRRIRAMEGRIGHPLFLRTEDGFLLTQEGEAILVNVTQMEDEANAVSRKLAGESQLEGLLRVSTTEWFGAHLLAPVFARFCTLHPGFVIELVTETQLVSLARREADLVFRFRQFDEPDVIQRQAAQMAFGVYAASSYLLRQGLPDSEGRGHSIVTMDRAYADLADVKWIKERLPCARISLRANSRDVQAQLCRSGGGLAVLPRCIGDAIPGLELLDLGQAAPGRTVWAGYHKDLKRSTRLRALLDATLTELSPSASATIAGGT